MIKAYAENGEGIDRSEGFTGAVRFQFLGNAVCLAY
jgi:hypothetical protein